MAISLHCHDSLRRDHLSSTPKRLRSYTIGGDFYDYHHRHNRHAISTSSTLRPMTAAGASSSRRWCDARRFGRPAARQGRQALIERIDNERDRFEDQLDGKIKSSIIRGQGEVNVERFLDDLQENVDRLNERFKSDYAASAEVTTVLRQGSDIQRFMSKQPPDLDGASEWNRLASSLGELAKVYATTFPLPEGQQARRAQR